MQLLRFTPAFLPALLACAGPGRTPSAHIGSVPAPERPPIDLDVSGEAFPVFRIPALAVARSGVLLAAYDGRPSGADVPSDIALLLRRSLDEGATWLPRQVIRHDAAPNGYGDPSFVVDRETGRIFLFHAASIEQGFTGSATGNDDSDPRILHADVSWSDDEGVTWRHRRLTSEIKRPVWGGTFAASGAGIQVRRGRYAGRLVQQFVIRHAGANWAASAFSDDHGDTWRMGALAGPGADENKVVELADGRLMLNSRGAPHRLVAYSSDGGATWSALMPDSQLVDPGNNGSIVRHAPAAVPGDPRAHWLLFSNTATRDARRNLTVRHSCDDGRTWAVTRVIEPGSAGYSTLVGLPSGRAGLLFERGRYEAISFVAFDPKLEAACGVESPDPGTIPPPPA